MVQLVHADAGISPVPDPPVIPVTGGSGWREVRCSDRSHDRRNPRPGGRPHSRRDHPMTSPMTTSVALLRNHLPRRLMRDRRDDVQWTAAAPLTTELGQPCGLSTSPPPRRRSRLRSGRSPPLLERSFTGESSWMGCNGWTVPTAHYNCHDPLADYLASVVIPVSLLNQRYRLFQGLWLFELYMFRMISGRTSPRALRRHPSREC